MPTEDERKDQLAFDNWKMEQAKAKALAAERAGFWVIFGMGGFVGFIVGLFVRVCP